MSLGKLDNGSVYMSYEQFNRFREEHPDLNVEYADNRIRIMTTATPAHSLIVSKVWKFLDSVVEGVGCSVYMNSLSVKFKKENTIQYKKSNPHKKTKNYIPDVVVKCDGNYEGNDYVGIPKLVVEVLSDNTADVDKGEKLETYALNGVEEYWIVDPRTKTAVVYKEPRVLGIIAGIPKYGYYIITPLTSSDKIEFRSQKTSLSSFFKNIPDADYRFE